MKQTTRSEVSRITKKRLKKYSGEKPRILLCISLRDNKPIAISVKKYIHDFSVEQKRENQCDEIYYIEYDSERNAHEDMLDLTIALNPEKVHINKLRKVAISLRQLRDAERQLGMRSTIRDVRSGLIDAGIKIHTVGTFQVVKIRDINAWIDTLIYEGAIKDIIWEDEQ